MWKLGHMSKGKMVVEIVYNTAGKDIKLSTSSIGSAFSQQRESCRQSRWNRLSGQGTPELVGRTRHETGKYHHARRRGRS
jgi:hypothetical protein